MKKKLSDERIKYLCEHHAPYIQKLILLFMDVAKTGQIQGGKLDKDQLWKFSTEAIMLGFWISNDAAEDGEVGDDVDDVIEKDYES